MSPSLGWPPSALVEKNASAVTGTVNATRINKYNPATTQAHRFIDLFFPANRHGYAYLLIRMAWQNLSNYSSAPSWRLDHLPGSRHIWGMNRELIRQQFVGRAVMVIRTSDGKQFAVPHPEFVFVGRHNIVVESASGL